MCPPLPSRSKGSISLGGLREGRRYTKPCRGTGAYGPGDPTKRCVDTTQQILQVQISQIKLGVNISQLG